MMLKENSGMPPPRMSSRPRTPVGICRIVTLAGWLTAFVVSLPLSASYWGLIVISFTKIQIVEGQFRPHVAHDPQH